MCTYNMPLLFVFAYRFLKRKSEFSTAIETVKKDVEEANRRLERYGNITVDIRLSIIAILNRIEEGRRKSKSRVSDSDLKAQMKTLYSKVYKLVKTVHSLQGMFKEEAERDYGPLLKPPTLQPRLLRIGSPVVSDESDGKITIYSFRILSIFLRESIPGRDTGLIIRTLG